MKNLVDLNKENTDEVLKNNELVLLDFHATWCGPCKTLNPLLNELAHENEGVIIGKVNVDENGDLASNYGVRGIPTIIFFKNGKEVDKIVGLKSKSEFQSMIDEYSK
jgi:thioredoxin 1